MRRMRTRVASIVMLRKCPLLRLGVRHAYHNTRYQNKGKMAVIAANLRDERNNLFPCLPLIHQPMVIVRRQCNEVTD